MILTPHILAGAAVATQTSNPVLIILVATSLHHVLDASPHWDYDIKSSRKSAAIKVTIDILLALAILLFFIRDLSLQQQVLILMGGFFGVLPDGLLFTNKASNGKYFFRYVKFHDFWHYLINPKGQKLNIIKGLPLQIIISLISMYLLLHLI